MTKSNRTQKFIVDDERFSGRYKQSLFKTLYFSYRPFLKRISILMIIGFLGRVFFLLNANLLGYWIDSTCVSCGQESFFGALFHGWTPKEFLWTLLMINLLGFIFTLIYRVFFSRYSAQAVSLLYDEVTYRTSRYPILFFDRNPVGRIVTRFASDFNNIFRIFGGPLADFLTIVFDMIAMIILITLAHPIYLVAVIIMAALDFTVYRLNRDRMRKERRALSLLRAPSIAHFSESAVGVSTIRTYLRQTQFSDRFKELDLEFLNQRIKTFKVLSLFSYKMIGMASLILFITGISAYHLQRSHLVSVGSIGVAITFITMSNSTLQIFFEWLAQLEEALTGVERLDHYLHLPIEAGATLPPNATFPTHHWKFHDISKQSQTQEDHARVLHPSAEVTISQLSFRYQPQLPWVLKNIEFSISPGEKFGIVGKTGSGKSSLIQSLYYLYPIEQGEITIDGHAPILAEDQKSDPHRIRLTSYRRLMNFISQDPILFRGTLRDNLVMDSKATTSLEALNHVLQKVGLLDWVQTLPGLHDFEIEERGKNLSQGEKQLICMARCLLQNAPVVILDEATSSVDPKSEEIMMRASYDFFAQRTQIIIAHRLSTLERCDRVLWLNEGHIEMIDTADEVLRRFERWS